MEVSGSSVGRMISTLLFFLLPLHRLPGKKNQTKTKKKPQNKTPQKNPIKMTLSLTAYSPSHCP